MPSIRHQLSFFLALTALGDDGVRPREPSFPLPAPIVVPASQDFDGNDGPWSSFTLQVGSPPQNLKVLISTAGYQTWVVHPQGCAPIDPSDCAILRGGNFIAEESTTWTNNTVHENSTFTLGLERNLGYGGHGLYGYDRVQLGWQGSGGPSLDQQIVAGIATKDFYLGVFGLTPRPTNFTNFNNPIPSYMENLKNRSLIPSLSWSYTAGNQYRKNKILASLTLGGYDASRFIPNRISFAFNDVDARDLTVIVDRIIVTLGDETTSLLSSSISAFVDSTIPYICLPLDACQMFETAFGIIWDNEVQAYIVDDTLHSLLQKRNPTITFTLTNGTAEMSVDIKLPYAAFDLIAQYPLMVNTTRYFPLMRAANNTQYTLGRTFLQETYLTADYERRNFSVSQCAWEATEQKVVPITSPFDRSPSSAHRWSKAAIAGTAIGGVIAISILILTFRFLYLRILAPMYHLENDRKAELGDGGSSQGRPSASPNEHEMENTQYFGQELDSHTHLGHEKDGRQCPGHEVEGNPRHEMDSAQYGVQELAGRKGDNTHELPARDKSRKGPPGENHGMEILSDI